MKLYVLAALLIFLAIAFYLISYGPFRGSENSDFSESWQPNDLNPFTPCPASPNCIRLSVPVQLQADELYDQVLQVLARMDTESTDANPDLYRIDAVFKIPAAGFRDDLGIQISKSDHSGETHLHIHSRSRKGYGDLGVNRRRISGVFQQLNITE